MISISDNTAADHLLKILGRERMESALAETKHTKPQMDMPFLSTLEMFKLKGEPTHKAAEQYLSLDVNGRRKFLAEQIARVRRETLS
jgi:beta-lactamase class A